MSSFEKNPTRRKMKATTKKMRMMTKATTATRSEHGTPTITFSKLVNTFQRHSEGFELQLISSLALARTREAMHNSWDKNDPKDAQVILHLLKSGLTQHY